jgi:hypothetical protein
VCVCVCVERIPLSLVFFPGLTIALIFYVSFSSFSPSPLQLF